MSHLIKLLERKSVVSAAIFHKRRGGAAPHDDEDSVLSPPARARPVTMVILFCHSESYKVALHNNLREQPKNKTTDHSPLYARASLKPTYRYIIYLYTYLFFML